MPGTLKLPLWVVLGFAAGFLFSACVNGTAPQGTPSPGRTQALEKVAAEEVYRDLVNRVLDSIGQGTRLLSSVGVQLSGSPEQATEAEGIVRPVKGSFELAREQLEKAAPPPGYERPHRQILDALSLYTLAAEALLPGPEAQEADYWRFQELMQQAGKNFHEGSASLDDVRRSTAGD